MAVRTLTTSRRWDAGTTAIWLLLAVGGLVMVFPIYWMFATAIRPKDDLFSHGVQLLPEAFVWTNLVDAWNSHPFGEWAINSAVIACIAVVITVFMNLLCGYTFAKYDFRGRTVLFLLMLSALMIPIQVIIVPQFLILSKLGLLNNYWGIILPRSAEAFGIFMVRQFMLSIPDDLLEAARLDGAGEFAIFRKIVLPLAGPVIAVLTIFTFMWRWNDFSLPLVVLTDQRMYTIQLGLNLLKDPYNIQWTNVMAIALISLLPMLAIFVLFQRQFVQGIASTGLK